MDAVNNAAATRSARSGSGRRDPERTREQILEAALIEFSDKGFEGARVDEIARRAGSNKRMLYHYFGHKDELFRAVLERAYADIREAENELDLEHLDPVEGMRRLVCFTFEYSVGNPRFMRLLNDENLHGARHLRNSDKIRQMHSPLVDLIADLLRRGERDGVFRGGVDPVQLYISIAALGYFYFSNIHTLSTIFGRDLMAKLAIEERRDHVVDVILGFLGS